MGEKVIVAGAKTFDDYTFLKQMLDDLLPEDIDEIVCGDAAGADTLGARYAEEHGIPVKHFPAEWEKYRKMGNANLAGPARNKQMAEHGTMLIAFYNGSTGTKNMIKQMKVQKKRYIIVPISRL